MLVPNPSDGGPPRVVNYDVRRQQSSTNVDGGGPAGPLFLVLVHHSHAPMEVPCSGDSSSQPSLPAPCSCRRPEPCSPTSARSSAAPTRAMRWSRPLPEVGHPPPRDDLHPDPAG